ncbi:MAG: NifB/NifX family molybdenum-iron cluster-binding protein [Bacteroidales bacterium]
MSKKIYFSFAVDNYNSLKEKHFGDAEKFLIYECNEKNEILFTKELINKYKNYDEYQNHGSQKKGFAIVEYLKENGIDVLVSKQFGKNIQIVNRQFVPVLVSGDTPKKVIPTLYHHIEAITEELKKGNEVFQHLNLK